MLFWVYKVVNRGKKGFGLHHRP